MFQVALSQPLSVRSAAPSARGAICTASKPQRPKRAAAAAARSWLGSPAQLSWSACVAAHGPVRSVAPARVPRVLAAGEVVAAGGMNLTPQLETIVESFQMVPDPKMRYRQLLFFAKELAGCPEEVKKEENKVIGCVSQVWIVGSLDAEGNVSYVGDSDSELTKGLAALLIRGLSGNKPADILRVSPEFVKELGLNQSLTPSRNNGFLNMLKRMQRIAVELAAGDGGSSSGGAGAAAAAEPAPQAAQEEEQDDGTVYSAIRRKLTAALKPAKLVIHDESAQHAGHAGARGYNGESHFRVEVVSAEFEGKNAVARQRMVYQVLADEMRERIHALALSTKTPAEAA
eukprot:tig00000076_g2322.t1